eukprot:sb/3461534/
MITCPYLIYETSAPIGCASSKGFLITHPALPGVPKVCATALELWSHGVFYEGAVLTNDYFDDVHLQLIIEIGIKVECLIKLSSAQVLREVISERHVLVVFTSIQILKQTLLTIMVVSAFSLYQVFAGGPIPTSLAAGCVSVVLLNMIRCQLTMGQSICSSVPDIAESLATLTTALSRDEIEPTVEVPENDYIVTSSSSGSGEEVAVTVDNGTFSWGSKRMDPKVLTEINLEIPRGKLTLIVGGEGSGKSSLLAALLGEMKCLVGEVRWARERNVALAAQLPVIFGMCDGIDLLFLYICVSRAGRTKHSLAMRGIRSIVLDCAPPVKHKCKEGLEHNKPCGSVSDNVLFGEKYDSDRYMKAITLCNLKEHTININESKALQPISLARVLYSRSSTVLLDEPLAGLEPESRDQFFFESVLLFAVGEEGRTVVMTTSNTELIEHAHKVVLLDEGRIVFAGSPSDLSPKHGILNDLRIAGPKSLPPPTPHRRRLEKRVPVEQSNTISVSKIPMSTYKEWVESCSLLKLVSSLMLLSCTAFLVSITYSNTQHKPDNMLSVLLILLLAPVTQSSDCNEPLHVGILDLLTPEETIRNIALQIRERRISDTQIIGFLDHVEDALCACTGTRTEDHLPCTIIKIVRLSVVPKMLKNLRRQTTQTGLVYAVRPVLDAVTREVCYAGDSIFKGYPSWVKCLSAIPGDYWVPHKPLFGEDLDLLKHVVLFSQEAKHLWEEVRKPLCSCGWLEMLNRHSWARVVDETNKKTGSCLDRGGKLGSSISSPSVSWVVQKSEIVWCKVRSEMCLIIMDEHFNSCCSVDFAAAVSDETSLRALEKVAGSEIREVVKRLQPTTTCPYGMYENYCSPDQNEYTEPLASCFSYWLLIRWLVDQNDKSMEKMAPGHSSTNITNKQHHYQFIASGCGSLLFQIFAVVLLISLIESGAQSLLMDMMSAVGRMSLGFYNKMPLPSLLARFVVDLELIGRPLMDCYVSLSFLCSEIICCLIVQNLHMLIRSHGRACIMLFSGPNNIFFKYSRTPIK